MVMYKHHSTKAPRQPTHLNKSRNFSSAGKTLNKMLSTPKRNLSQPKYVASVDTDDSSKYEMLHLTTKTIKQSQDGSSWLSMINITYII